MKRKTSTTPTRIWTYGLRWPRDPADEAAVREQMLLAHRYQNVLIEIERDRRKTFRELRSELSPELASLEKRVAELTLSIEAQRRDIKALRRKTRERTLDRSATATLRLLNTERKVAYKALKTSRARINESSELRDRAKALNDASHARVREARAKSGVYWGTYLLVERAMEAASRSKADPQFRRYRGGGRAGVQLQKGMTVGELFAGVDTRLQVKPLPANTWDTRPGRRRALTELRIRIGTTEDKKPRFAVFEDLLQHRPLPLDGIIKWAWVKIERIGLRSRWTLQISLESEEFAKRKHLPVSDETVAINLGWRVKPSGAIRVGYALGTDGRAEELLLPEEIRQKFFTTHRLRSANDLIFDEARKATGAWLAEYPADAELTPMVETLHAWRDHSKLVRVAMKLTARVATPTELRQLWLDWKVARFQATKDLYDAPAIVYDWLAARGVAPAARHPLYLLIWWKKNDHMWNMEASIRAKTLGWRKQLYRDYAATLARSYQTLLIEKFDLRAVAGKPHPEDEQDHVQAVALARTHAAPSELRAALVAAFHADWVEQSADHNTLACKTCGVITDAVPADAIVIACPGCGSEHDQDQNNCENQLARYRGEYRGPKPQAAE